MGLLNAIFGNKTKKIKDPQLRNILLLDVLGMAAYAKSTIPASQHLSLQEIDSKENQIINS